MRRVTVVIGETEHEVRELPSRKAAEWRNRLQERLGEISSLFERAPETDISSPAAITALVQQLGSIVIKSPDTVIELLLTYAPDLRAVVDEADCYDSELIAAFVEVLRLAYPFGGLVSLVASLGRGEQPKATLTS